MKKFPAKKSYFFISLILLFFVFALIFNPESCMQSILKGLSTWLCCVVPALFPFLIFTKLLTSFGFAEIISQKLGKITSKLFNVPGVSGYVFFMSILSGYPIGAKLTSELFKEQKISQVQATRMCSFCSTSGPLFIIGSVGVALFQDKLIGFLILVAHILGAILNGLVFRFYKKSENTVFEQKNTKKIGYDEILSKTMYDSIVSILMIGGFVSIFFMIVDVLFQFHILSIFEFVLEKIFCFFGIDQNFSTPLLSGFFEMTKGCQELSVLNTTKTAVTVCGTAIVSFGGLCIHLQSLAFLQATKIKLKLYFFMKFCQAIFSALIAFFLCLMLF